MRQAPRSGLAHKTAELVEQQVQVALAQGVAQQIHLQQAVPGGGVIDTKADRAEIR
jgi:hypothetical protein